MPLKARAKVYSVCLPLPTVFVCLACSVRKAQARVCVIVATVLPCAERLLVHCTHPILPTPPHQTHSAEHTNTHTQRPYAHIVTHKAECSDVTELTPADWNRHLCKHVIKSAYSFKHVRAIKRHTYIQDHQNIVIFGHSTGHTDDRYPNMGKAAFELFLAFIAQALKHTICKHIQSCNESEKQN